VVIVVDKRQPDEVSYLRLFIFIDGPGCSLEKLHIAHLRAGNASAIGSYHPREDLYVVHDVRRKFLELALLFRTNPGLDLLLLFAAENFCPDPLEFWPISYSRRCVGKLHHSR
jgi:hypothetical protein